jgi:hypothetical protein
MRQRLVQSKLFSPVGKGALFCSRDAKFGDAVNQLNDRPYDLSRETLQGPQIAHRSHGRNGRDATGDERHSACDKGEWGMVIKHQAKVKQGQAAGDQNL